jgi:hypothetical protein
MRSTTGRIVDGGPSTDTKNLKSQRAYAYGLLLFLPVG